MLISSPEVRAAAAEDDPVGFKLYVIDADHNVTQLSLQQDLSEDWITDGAHCPNVARGVWITGKLVFFFLMLCNNQDEL